MRVGTFDPGGVSVFPDSYRADWLLAKCNGVCFGSCDRIHGEGTRAMTLYDYKTILYRQEDGSWVAEIPAIPGCYALMPTREEALAELAAVFEMIEQEYGEKGLPLPADTTEIVHA
jgi:predicted RNase H-like HicB family nuclease